MATGTLTLTTDNIWLKGTSSASQVWTPTLSKLPEGSMVYKATLICASNNTYNSPGAAQIYWGSSASDSNLLWEMVGATGKGEYFSVDLSGRIHGNGSFSLLFRKTANASGTTSNVVFNDITVKIEYTDSVSSFTLNTASVAAGTAMGLTINPAGSGYTHNVYITFGSRSYTEYGLSGTSFSYTIPVDWLDQIPNAVSGTGTVTVETISGSGASLGSVSESFTLTAGSGSNPTLGTITATLLDGLNGLYIQGHSRCEVTVRGYAAGDGATVASVLISGNGDSTWSDTLTSSKLRTAGTVTFTVTVKDSRGRESSGTVSITVTNYADIAITGKTALRCTSDGTVSRTKGKSAKLGCSYAMTAVSGNAATVRVYWRVYGEDAWTEINGWDSASGYTAVALTDTVALDERYEILFVVEDRMSRAEQTATIEPGSVFMIWSKLRQAFGFGTYPSGEKQVAIAEDWKLMLGNTDVGNALQQRSRVRNLLDNSDFRNPVNQRGASSYKGAVYSIDRWRSWQSASVITLNDGYITHTETLYQYVSGLELDKIYTFAIGTSDGNTYCVTATPRGGVWQYGIGISYDSSENVPYVAINQDRPNVVWAALYEGEYTADTLPTYVPKGYGAELAECMRYYQKFDFDLSKIGVNATKGYPERIPVRLSVPMRIVPTVTLSKSWSSALSGNATTGYVTKDGFCFCIIATGTSAYVEWHGSIACSADL